jgi:hypothetical protein
VALWSPTVLATVAGQNIGWVGWLSGLVAVVSTIGLVAIGLSSDHFKERYGMSGCAA